MKNKQSVRRSSIDVNSPSFLAGIGRNGKIFIEDIHRRRVYASISLDQTPLETLWSELEELGIYESPVIVRHGGRSYLWNDYLAHVCFAHGRISESYFINATEIKEE